jgi:hypothetical protein
MIDEDDFMQTNIIPNEHLIPHIHAIFSSKIQLYQH